MTPLPEQAAARRLKAALEKEMAFLPEIEAFLGEALRALEEAAPARIPVQAAAVGAAVSDAYLLVENVLKAIARTFEGMPEGPDWHAELLEAAALDIPEVRPPVVRGHTRALLEELRRFRHVVRNVYGMRLDARRAREIAAAAPVAIAAFREDIEAFRRFLDALCTA